MGPPRTLVLPLCLFGKHLFWLPSRKPSRLSAGMCLLQEPSCSVFPRHTLVPVQFSSSTPSLHDCWDFLKPASQCDWKHPEAVDVLLISVGLSAPSRVLAVLLYTQELEDVVASCFYPLLPSTR